MNAAVTTELKVIDHWIGGQAVRGESGRSGPVYNPTSVGVTLTRTPFGAVAGLSANQQAVGNALEGAYATTLTGAAATLYTNLLMTGTPEALSQLSGEGTSATQNAVSPTRP